MHRNQFIPPRIVVSKCLGFEACRYNGDIIRDDLLGALDAHVEFVQVCPEVEIGLGTPRDTVKLVSESSDPSRLQIVQPASGLDLTGKMNGFASQFLDSLEDVDGFVLKSASPSCAIKDAKYYSSWEKGAAFKKGPGLFGRAVLERFPHLIVEDEGRLKNLVLREHFLTRIFTVARFRFLKKSPSKAGLVKFQTDHKLLLLAYNQKELRNLGRIVANTERAPLATLMERYQETLCRALARVPRRNSNINVLMHGFGYVSDNLKSSEKAYFLDILEKYRKHQVPLSTSVEVLRSWLIRFDVQYLLRQNYFEPFPYELVSLRDSGRRRALN